MSIWRRSLAVGLLAVAGVGAAPTFAQSAPPLLDVRSEPARNPWWQRATWHPRSTVLYGTPIKRLHPDWCSAEAFKPELFGDGLLGSASPLEGQAFTLEGSFDGTGRSQRAFVGVYRRCSGESGLFVAIIEPHPGRTRTRFLVEVPDAPSAIAVLGREPDGALAVWWCVACDEGHRIAYNRESKGFFVAGPATRRP